MKQKRSKPSQPTISAQLYTRNYSSKDTIEGVKIIEINRYVEEDGDFSEIFRLGKSGEIEAVPDFFVAQVNRTKLNPMHIKAWHLHLEQDVLWYISPSQRVIAGLWDVRKKSATSQKKMKVVLGDGQSQLLYIPRGVAHGSANYSSESVDLYYFANRHFNAINPDEKRIDMSESDIAFWKPSQD